MQTIRVLLDEQEMAEQQVLRKAYRNRAVIDWHGFTVRVTGELVLGQEGQPAPSIYELTPATRGATNR